MRRRVTFLDDICKSIPKLVVEAQVYKEPYDVNENGDPEV